MRILPLVGTQLGIWLAEQTTGRGNAYVIAHAVEIEGALSLVTFEAALRQALGEADTVTARFFADETGVFQALENLEASASGLVLEQIDLSEAPDPIAAAHELTHADIATDLPASGQRPLCRQVLIRLGTESPHWLWYQRYHHLMLDGFSFTALTRRVADIYTAQLQNRDAGPSPFSPVESVIEEHRAYAVSPAPARDRAFWRSYCRDLPAACDLSVRPPRSGPETKARTLVHVQRLSAETFAALEAEAAGAKVTAFDFLMAAVAAYLARMSGRSAQVVGVPFMRRLGSVAASAAAPVVNVLPVRIPADPDLPLTVLAKRVNAALAEVRRHQRYDAEEIQRDLGYVGTGRALYGPVVNYRMFDYDLDFGGIRGVTHHLATGPVDDIEFGILIRDGEITLELRADSVRYDADDLARHGLRLARIVASVQTDPGLPSGRLPIIAEAESRLIAASATGIATRPLGDAETIIDIFAANAAATPDATALVAGDRTLSFGALSADVFRLARHLAATGLGPGDTVAVALPRGVDQVIAVLGILASGAAYMPLDLNYPDERLEAMCADARPGCVLTLRKAADRVPGGIPALIMDDCAVAADIAVRSGARIHANERTRELRGDDIAALFFTSGSTGRPKGVMTTHAALMNLISSHERDIYGPGRSAVGRKSGGRRLRAAHTHSFAFDSSWLQLFWMLLGQELHIVNEDMRRDAQSLVAHIQAEEIDALDLPPSFCAQLLGAGLLDADRHHPTVLLIGGEAAAPALWAELNAHPGLLAHNLYGPTEYTVDTLRAAVAESETPLVGRPIGNTRIRVLDRLLQEVPVGAAGELYTTGPGLARGYCGQPALTAERFVADPFGEGGVMYRTGDLVRWTADGRIAFLGRADRQVKVRGYRVEIPEIEAALTALPTVETALVVAEAVNGSHRLLAYCTLKDRGASGRRDGRAQELRHALQERLPDYMVPAVVMIVDAFPLTVNGKIDRARLPAPMTSGKACPSTPEERCVARAMAQALKLPAVSADDDFFTLGGDSISAIVLCNALRREGFLLHPRDVFVNRDPYRIAKAMTRRLDTASAAPTRLEVASAAERTALSARYGAVAEVLPVLPTQKGLLFHSDLGRQAENYNAFTRMTLDGPLDAARLARAFDRLMRRHPQLAGVFDTSGEEPVLVVPQLPADGPLWPITVHDFAGLDAADLPAALARIEATTTERNLVAPAFRRLVHAELIRLSPERHVLIVLVHHLLIDGWSTPLLLRDLMIAYGSDAELPPLAIPYAEVVQRLVTRDFHPSRSVWETALATAVPCLLFEQVAPTACVEEASFTLSPETTDALLTEARRRGITLNILMQGVWGAVLCMLAGRDEVIFGTPVSGRAPDVPGIAAQIGLFLNTVPVRIALVAGASLWDQMAALQARHAELMDHDGLGLAEIQTIAGAGTLFDTLLVVENYPDSDYLKQDFAGLTLSDIRNRGYSHYPLALLVLPGAGAGLTLLLENRGAVDDAAGLVSRIGSLLDALAAEPSRPFHALSLAGPQDIAVMAAANDTARPMPPITVRDVLAAQAARTPERVALEDADTRLTFRDVRHQVLDLARRLKAMGARPGEVVAVALPRSVRLSLALLAVAEAGAAFLPLDLSYPAERLAFMLDDAAPRIVITDSTVHLPLVDKVPALIFDTLADPDTEAGAGTLEDGLSPAHPAYLLYTSGTTGQPKGALISHAAIVNRLLWMQHQYPLGGEDAVLQKTACGFDVSVWEFFWPFMVGARLVMAPPDAHRDPDALVELIAHHGITVMHFVPSMLTIFLGLLEDDAGCRERCRSLSTIFASGEALSKELARRFGALLPRPALHNLYGPTEAAVDVTYAPAAGAVTEGAGGVPIGRPIWNTALRILDHHLRPVPVGFTGELYLSGVQLAEGYLGRPNLTAERFVADPFASGQRMYRTGDLARWRSDGQVDYLGRTDHQIKIRGQRVELGEIEVQMAHLPGVAQAVAQAIELTGVAGGADGRQIVGYVVPAPGARVVPTLVREALKAMLPSHMLPAIVVVIDSLPLSANGKLDRKALPVPVPGTADRVAARAPADGLEASLAAIFARLLNCERVGVDDDFFAIGGHSLLAMRLAACIRRELGRKVSVGQIVIMPTVAKLARHLAAGELAGSLARSGFDLVVRLREGEGTPLICMYPGSGVSWQYNVLSRYLKGERPIIGLQSPRPNGPIASSRSIAEVCDRQLAILREVQPHGPYDLLGYSLGGTIAYGLAVRLRQMGEEVRFLGLLDTYPAEVHDWSDPDGAGADLGAEREQERLITDAMADMADDDFRREKAEMFGHIFDNYRDAVTLLSQARTEDYPGEVTLFVAGRSMPPGIDAEAAWSDRVGRLSIHRLAHCSHEDIVSPASLEILGPLLNALIEQAEAAGGRQAPIVPTRMPDRLAG